MRVQKDKPNENQTKITEQTKKIHLENIFNKLRFWITLVGKAKCDRSATELQAENTF